MIRMHGEGNAPCLALLQHEQGVPVCWVHGILHACDVSDRQRVNQMLTGILLRPMPSIKPLSRALIVAVSWSSNRWPGSASSMGLKLTAARWSPPACASCLNSLRELGRRIETQHPA